VDFLVAHGLASFTKASDQAVKALFEIWHSISLSSVVPAYCTQRFATAQHRFRLRTNFCISFVSHEFISTNRRYPKSLLFNLCYSQSLLLACNLDIQSSTNQVQPPTGSKIHWQPYLLFESVLPSSMKPPAPSTPLPTELNLLKEPSQRDVSKRKYTLGLIGVWTLL
jgi:hypothetical protein